MTPAQMSETLDACRKAISNDHGVALQSMILIKTRTIDKTTSGKIARSWCRRSYVAGTLQVVAKWERPMAGGDVEEEGEELDGTIMGVSDASALSDQAEKGEAKEDSETGAKLPDEGHMEMDGPVGDHDRDKYKMMAVSEIEELLEKKLVHITANSATGEIPTPVDRHTSMMAMGLESMTMVQFKGVIENRCVAAAQKSILIDKYLVSYYIVILMTIVGSVLVRFYCEFPDEFMFTDYATLHELSEAIQHGSLTDRQKDLLETAPPPGSQPESGDNAGTTTIVQQDPPCCPWFVCCY